MTELTNTAKQEELTESAESPSESSQYPLEEAYEYPLSPGKEGWDRNWSHDEMVQKCAVPKEIVDAMTTSALAQTVANYPLLSAAITAEDPDSGISSIKEELYALQALLEREDALQAVGEQLRSDRFLGKDNQSAIGRRFLEYLFVQLAPKGTTLPEKAAADPARYTLNEAYDYPLRPGDPGWRKLDGLQEMAAACQIPLDILNHLTTEALFETVLNYPLLSNINAYLPDLKAGALSVWTYFNGLRELLERDGAKELVEDLISDIKAAENDGSASPEESLQRSALQGILELFPAE